MVTLSAILGAAGATAAYRAALAIGNAAPVGSVRNRIAVALGGGGGGPREPA